MPTNENKNIGLNDQQRLDNDRMQMTFLHSASQHLEKSFAKLARKVFHDDLAMVQDYASLLLIEVMKNYTDPGGFFRLKKEILSFDPEHSKLLRNKQQTAGTKQKKDGPLKILIVSGMFPCTDHGGGLRLFDIVRKLSKEHEVDIFSIFNEKLDTSSYELLKDGLHNIKLIKENEMQFPNLQKWLQEIEREFSYYDVVQFEYPHTTGLISQAKKFGAKTGFTFMECQTKSFAIFIFNLIKENRFQELEKYTKKFWNYLLAEKKAVDNADFLIAVTRGDAKAVNELGKTKAQIIPTCISDYAVIDEIEKHRDIHPEGNSVSFLGYYGHYPNIDGMHWYLNEVHPLIKNKIPSYKIYIVGRGDTSILQEISPEDQNIVFTGRVDSIIPSILQAKVCILPLTNGAGIRGKLNQYAIAGRPSVSTSIGTHGLAYVDEESVLVANEPLKFANDIIRLLTDDLLYEKIRGNAKKIAEENYTWKNHIAKLVDIYRD